MITEQYVTLETARLLKEAGFDEICRCDYDNVGGFRWFRICKSIPKGWVPCPTQALAARWLREVHNIMIVPFFDDYMGKWYYVIDGVKKQSGIKCVQSASDYYNYEEAIEAGLKHSLELIKK